MIPRGILSWQKNKKVEMTSPGSKNHYKVTYHDGQQKWTDDKPGDGKPGRREERLKERKQSRPSIKDAKKTLGNAVKKYVDGGDEKGLVNAVDGVIVHVGREVARETVRGYIDEHKDADGKEKEAQGILRKRLLEKTRKKEAMDNRIEKMARSVVASQVTDVLASQVRHFLPELRRAISKAFEGRTFVPAGIMKINDYTVIFKFKTFRKEEEAFEAMAGAYVEYDVGSDTYIFKPFYMTPAGDMIDGTKVSDFYVEDFGDVFKVQSIFQRLVKSVV